MILSVVQGIPEGQFMSYGEVARQAGLPGYARYVGYVLKSMPENSRIPWHRVVNAQQKISFPPDTAAYREQKQRLLSEGFTFTPAGKLQAMR